MTSPKSVITTDFARGGLRAMNCSIHFLIAGLGVEGMAGVKLLLGAASAVSFD
jgi:hypothetical protein